MNERQMNTIEHGPWRGAPAVLTDIPGQDFKSLCFKPYMQCRINRLMGLAQGKFCAWAPATLPRINASGGGGGGGGVPLRWAQQGRR